MHLRDILFPYRVIGGFGFVIKNQDNSIFWTPYLYAPSLATDTNVFQKKGSDISYYSILFNFTDRIYSKSTILIYFPIEIV